MPLEPWRKNLTRLIQEHGAEEFRRRLGVRAPTVTRWKKAQRWPEPGMVLRICEAFGVTLEELFGVSRQQSEIGEAKHRFDAPSHSELVGVALRLRQAQADVALRLRQAQAVVDSYLSDEDRELLEARLRREASTGRETGPRDPEPQ